MITLVALHLRFVLCLYHWLINERAEERLLAVGRRRGLLLMSSSTLIMEIGMVFRIKSSIYDIISKAIKSLITSPTDCDCTMTSRFATSHRMPPVIFMDEMMNENRLLYPWNLNG